MNEIDKKLRRTVIGRVLPKHRGEWKPDTEYERLDFVVCGGSGYICMEYNMSIHPMTDNAGKYWKLIFQKGERGRDGMPGVGCPVFVGDWNRKTTYSHFDIVRYNGDCWLNTSRDGSTGIEPGSETGSTVYGKNCCSNHTLQEHFAQYNIDIPYDAETWLAKFEGFQCNCNNCKKCEEDQKRLEGDVTVNDDHHDDVNDDHHDDETDNIEATDYYEGTIIGIQTEQPALGEDTIIKFKTTQTDIERDPSLGTNEDPVENDGDCICLSEYDSHKLDEFKGHESLDLCKGNQCAYLYSLYKDHVSHTHSEKCYKSWVRICKGVDYEFTNEGEVQFLDYKKPINIKTLSKHVYDEQNGETVDTEVRRLQNTLKKIITVLDERYGIKLGTTEDDFFK